MRALAAETRNIGGWRDMGDKVQTPKRDDTGRNRYSATAQFPPRDTLAVVLARAVILTKHGTIRRRERGQLAAKETTLEMEMQTGSSIEHGV